MKNELATLVFIAAAAASMGTSQPASPGITGSIDIEAVRIDEMQEKQELRVSAAFPQGALKNEDFESVFLNVFMAAESGSEGHVLLKLSKSGESNGAFGHIESFTGNQARISRAFEDVCTDGVCRYEGTISLERVGAGSSLVGGTVEASIFWSYDVDPKARVPLVEELEIKIER